MRGFFLRRVALACGLLLAAGLTTAATAGATTYSWTVSMSGNDVIASGLPANGSATGSASITGDDSANRMCGTFTWSGVAGPVVFGHIHQGTYGKPENPAVTVNFFGPTLGGAPSGVSGCTIVPGTLIDEMAKFPWLFMVTIHNQQYPGGAIRGQLGSGNINLYNTLCTLDRALCPGP